METLEKPRYTPEHIAKASFLYFQSRVLCRQIGAHHIEWDHLLNGHPNPSDVLLLNCRLCREKDPGRYLRLLIECARGHGKTWNISEAFSLWRQYGPTYDADGRLVRAEVILVSNTEDQAAKILKEIDREVHTNDKLAHLRPGSKRSWGALFQEYPWGQIRGYGFGSSIRGEHPTDLIVDDPLKDQGGMDPEEQYKYFTGALSGTAMRSTRIVVVGTPMDSGDLLEQLEGNEAYRFASYPALDTTGNPLFPYLFTKAELESKQKEVGSLAFAREYLLQRIDPKTQMFKDQYRTINTDFQFPKFVAVRTLTDPAISEKERACDSALTTWGIDERNEYWEMETDLIHKDDPYEVLKRMYNVARRNSLKHYDYALVGEDEVFQKLFGMDFKKLCLQNNADIRYIGVVHHGNTGKHQRICGLQSAWEARGIHLLPGSPLISQFRYYRPQLKGAPIDGIDAFSWIRNEDVWSPYNKNAVAVDPGVPESVHE